MLIFCGVVAPYFEISQNISLYRVTNYVPSQICNQYPTHCFYLFGSNMGLCARCLFIYAAITLMALFRVIYVYDPLNQIIIVASGVLIVPMLIDGLTQLYGLRISNNYLRAITGFAGGIGLFLLLDIIRTVLIGVTNKLRGGKNG